jgi:phosphoribosylglycinamide formyltransferase-1
MLAVLVSGSGTNLQAILDAKLPVSLVLSNKPGVLALERASKAGVATRVLSHKDFASRDEYDAALVEILRGAGIEYVALAGFMRLLTRRFLDAFAGRVVNIHPSLLPAFPGVHSQKQALDYGVKVAGCTVHFVDEGTDTGPIIAQATVDVREGDDEASLSARILEREHALYPAILRALIDGQVRLVSRAGARMTAWT